MVRKLNVTLHGQLSVNDPNVNLYQFVTSQYLESKVQRSDLSKVT